MLGWVLGGPISTANLSTETWSKIRGAQDQSSHPVWQGASPSENSPGFKMRSKNGSKYIEMCRPMFKKWTYNIFEKTFAIHLFQSCSSHGSRWESICPPLCAQASTVIGTLGASQQVSSAGKGRLARRFQVEPFSKYLMARDPWKHISWVEWSNAKKKRCESLWIVRNIESMMPFLSVSCLGRLAPLDTSRLVRRQNPHTQALRLTSLESITSAYLPQIPLSPCRSILPESMAKSSLTRTLLPKGVCRTMPSSTALNSGGSGRSRQFTRRLATLVTYCCQRWLNLASECTNFLHRLELSLNLFTSPTMKTLTPWPPSYVYRWISCGLAASQCLRSKANFKGLSPSASGSCSWCTWGPRWTKDRSTIGMIQDLPSEIFFNQFSS